MFINEFSIFSDSNGNGMAGQEKDCYEKPIFDVLIVEVERCYRRDDHRIDIEGQKSRSRDVKPEGTDQRIIAAPVTDEEICHILEAG